jgi:hypothetical protein
MESNEKLQSDKNRKINGSAGSMYKDDDESSDGRPTERFDDEEGDAAKAVSVTSSGRPTEGDEEEGLRVMTSASLSSRSSAEGGEEEALGPDSSAGDRYKDEITERNDIAIFTDGDQTETEASEGEELRIIGVGIVDDISSHDVDSSSVHDVSGREILIDATESSSPKDTPDSEEGRASFFDGPQESKIEPQVIRRYSNRVSVDAPATITSRDEYSASSSLQGSESGPQPGEISIGIGGNSSHHSQSESHPQPGEISIGIGGTSSHHSQSSSQFPDADEKKKFIAASIPSNSAAQPVTKRTTRGSHRSAGHNDEGKVTRDDDTHDESVSTVARNEEDPANNSFDWILRSLQS